MEADLSDTDNDIRLENKLIYQREKGTECFLFFRNDRRLNIY